MLIQFSVKNYKTFKDPAVLSLIAADEFLEYQNNVYYHQDFKIKILKSAVIYGANASGKTKLIDAFDFFKYFTLFNVTRNLNESIDVEPFLLNTETENQPSEFEIVFIHNHQIFRYGYEVNTQEVNSEWLYVKLPNKKKENLIFYREGSNYEISTKEFEKGKKVKDLVRNNSLFLTVAAQFNETLAQQIIDWFLKLQVLSAVREKGYLNFTSKIIENQQKKHLILEYLKSADIDIEDLKLKKLGIQDLSKRLPNKLREIIARESNQEVYSVHRKYDKKGNWIENIEFLFKEKESEGTQKLFAFLGPIIDVLENGYPLIVDELDSKLHPNLVKWIVQLFHNQEINTKHAQLIFNTHNTNLLNDDIFRKDQIWFVQKNTRGEAKIYSLMDFQNAEQIPHKEIENNYLIGKYGGIPYLKNNFSKKLTIKTTKQEEKLNKKTQSS